MEKIKLEIKYDNMNNFEYKNYNEQPEIMLSDCDISLRALNYLQSAGINKLNDVTNYREEELRKKIPMANSKVFQELKEILKEHNLSFKV